MGKIMFDSCSFDKLIDNMGSITDFNEGDGDYEFYITPIQIEELAQISDDQKEKRIRLFLGLCSMRAILVPSIAILGNARLGFCKLASEEDAKLLQDLNGNGENNENDSMIGVSAKQEGCTVVTADNRFAKRLEKCGIPNMSFEEFWPLFLSSKS